MKRKALFCLCTILFTTTAAMTASSATLTGPQGAVAVQVFGTPGFNTVTILPATVVPGDLVSVASNQTQPGIVSYDNGCKVPVPPGTVYPVQVEVNCDPGAGLFSDLGDYLLGLGIVGAAAGGILLFSSDPPPPPSSP